MALLNGSGFSLGPSSNSQASLRCFGGWGTAPCHWTEKHIKANVASGGTLEHFYQNLLPTLSLVTVTATNLLPDYLKPKP